MLTDIEIAQNTRPRPISEIAARAGIDEKYIEPYGKYKAKVDSACFDEGRPDGKLILVTAITPTAAGEGKTTISIGLADALRCIGKSSAAALREPSLGPVFGIKGGAAGGGYAQVIPMEDINLHFTGDIHAITAANNLLAAMLDNHIYQGNALGIDESRVTWKRCMDMNDRQLRYVRDGLGGDVNGVPRDDGFDITAASEVMAILCLASSFEDLKRRLASIVVGENKDGKPVTAGQLNAHGAMAALLRDAMKPNLVQTLEGTPVFVHGGPFANIAHGCNSVVATRTALKAADYVVTEAGFGSDLGAEKFIDIKCRTAGLKPSCCVLVATVKALKLQGGADAKRLKVEDREALKRGLPNLERHIMNIKNVYRLPLIVALNRNASDTDAEISDVREKCISLGAEFSAASVFAEGGKGGAELAEKVVEMCQAPCEFSYVYDTDAPIKDKLDCVVRKIYAGNEAVLSEEAQAQAKMLEEQGFGSLPVCIAKTQYSFTDDKSVPGAPSDFNITIRELKVSAGAGFIVAKAGKIMTMPGLPRVPAAEGIDVSSDGVINGLF
ncbi:MAG: formate--tetrahydrofolate ligase [Clostridiales bacterium]|nr:formate--tetrahydrofolate ligase [Clostridiales bacterium]